MTTVSDTVGSQARLAADIASIDAGTGINGQTGTAYALTLANTITLAAASPLPAIDLPGGIALSINGAGYMLLANGNRGLFVTAGSVTVQGLTIEGAVAQGANGVFGGGGGGGLGGGVFVGAHAAVTLVGVVFSGDAAFGGQGGAGVPGQPHHGRNGGDGGGPGGPGGAGVYPGSTATLGVGGADGAGGVPGPTPQGQTGGTGGFGGGGGGGGGGAGGNGGGLANLSFSGGSSGGTPGTRGAFGQIGPGGFGGGQGGSGASGASGGYGNLRSVGTGGDGGAGGGGGGGLGAGGDVFVQAGGALTIEGGSLSGGMVRGGVGGAAGGEGAPGGTEGSALGAGVFLMGNQTLTLGAPAGQTLSVNDAITDQGGNGGSGGIVVNSAGTVDVETSVSIAGGVTLDQGQLTLGDNAAVFAQGYTFAGAATLDVRETIPHLLDGGPAELAGTPLVGNIADFGLGDTLVLRGVAAAAGGTDAITYDFVAGTQSVTETLPLSIKQGVLLVEPTLVQPDAEVPDTLDFTFTAIPSGLACFAAGTRIATLAGELAVEALAAGDRVVLAGGGTRPVRWVGRRQIDLRRHPRPHEVRPLRVCAGAIADGVPARELLLSPDHALFLDGALVTVRLLRNDASICTDDALDTVTYFHVELDAHDILLADGLAAESYLDTGNRDAFENGAATVALHPVFQGQHGREARSCAKLLTDPARLEAVWRRLAARATTLRPAVPRRESTDDPDLCVRVDGRQLRPVSRHAGRFVFALPAAPAGARLTSRSALPCDTSPWLDDRRRLGVFVRRLVVHEGGQPRAISLDDPGLRAGWWQPEASGRWTNGDAALPSWREPAVLHVDVGSTLAYKLPASAGRVITRNGCTGNG